MKYLFLFFVLFIFTSNKLSANSGCFSDNSPFKVYTYYLGSKVEDGETIYYYSSDINGSYPSSNYEYLGNPNPSCLPEKGNDFQYDCKIIVGTVLPLHYYNVSYSAGSVSSMVTAVGCSIDSELCMLILLVAIFLIPNLFRPTLCIEILDNT